MSSCLLFLLLSLLPLIRGEEGRVLGLRLAQVDSKRGYSEEGVVEVMAGEQARLQVLGTGLVGGNLIKLTTEARERGEECGGSNGTFIQTGELILYTEEDDNTDKVFLDLGRDDVMYSAKMDTFFVCLQSSDGRFIHQGAELEVSLKLFQRMLPLWLMIIMVSLLLILSGLFSGLNLGLMALDQTELQILIKTGTEREQEDAKSIMPVRALGNFLLCSLLLGNVLVNNSLTIMLDNITGGGGLIAIIGSTFGIVVFGEIIPQAVCSRHGLAVGAKTLGITKFFMLLTSPLSFPISKLLDLLLGEELGTVYNRARLIELLRVTQDDIDLNKDEVNILTGALVLQEKKVSDIMTPLADCYMLPLEALLDFETISEIKEKGYSRIPVYEDDETNVKHILLAKDLLFVDPDDKKPLAEVCNFYKTPFTMTEKNTPLNKMLDEFKTGEKGHLAIVTEDSEAIGLVTLEDIIEEIIQSEIVDETDIVIDNKSKTKRRKKGRFLKEKEVRMFMESKEDKIDVSPQVQHAVLQFLSTSVPPFHAELLRSDIIKKLLLLDVFRTIKVSADDQEVNSIIRRGEPCDFFLLVVEGKVNVEIGTEGYIFESGPFTSFGKQILSQVVQQGTKDQTDLVKVSKLTWLPECTISPKSEEVLYLKLRHNTYRAALLASKERGEGGSEVMEEHIRSMIRAQTSVEEESETSPLI